ncbi:MAG: ATP-binding protein [Thermonemataceae bacterium]
MGVFRNDLHWLGEVFRRCINHCLSNQHFYTEVEKNEPKFNHRELAAFSFPASLTFPQIVEETYEQLVQKYQWQTYAPEKMVFLLSVVPYALPSFLTEIAESNELIFQLGLKKGKASSYLPTGTTALQVLTKSFICSLPEVFKLFHDDHPLIKDELVILEKMPEEEPFLNGTLTLSREYLHLLNTGERYRPALNKEFPAERLTTEQSWDDYILPTKTWVKVEELLDWVSYYAQLRSTKGFTTGAKGYKCLLTGPSGTGKTMLGRLLAQKTERQVWRLDISRLVSKFVGETTKNIRKVFDIAQHYDYILFCDEGEGLFSNRTRDAGTAQDTYVNQEVGYLLQSIEEYPGIILVATNNISNMDNAFMRRFNTRITFEYPDEQCLIQLWEKAFAPFQLDTDVDVRYIAQEHHRHQVTGAKIALVKDLLGIRALKRDDWRVSREELEFALKQKQVRVPDFEAYLKRKAESQALFGEE